MNQATGRKPPVFGPEPWSEVAGRLWSYWDLWFAVVAVADHASALDQLEEQLVGELRRHLDGRDAAEYKLSHLADLRARLREARLGPADLARADAMRDRALVAKARKKMAGRWIEGRAMTPAMVETPRVQLVRRARMGRWSKFPVDPAVYYKSFRRNVEVKDRITKNRSFGAVERVQERLRALDKPSLSEAQRLALYRAFHTAGLELMERADDSYGNVDQMREEAWHTYLKLDWQAAGMKPTDYWADIGDLVVFEDYGLGFKEETRPWLHVPAGQAEVIEDYLTQLERECRAAFLDYQADEALQQLAWLAVAGRRFSHYVEVATRLGTDHWMPIEALADSALRSGKKDLAVETFQAADRPGFHRRHLRDRCQAMTGVHLEDESETKPTLRIVRDGKTGELSR